MPPQVGAGGGQFHPLAQQARFSALAASVEAVEQAPHGPEVVWMHLGAGQAARQAQVFAIGLFRLGHPALLQQQRPQGMADGLHPAPGLVIGQVVFQRDGGPQVGKGRVFYFRPGHETYPVFQQAGPLRVLENAVRWLAGK